MLYTKLFEAEKNPFTKDFIETIAKWQNYGISSSTDPFIKVLNKLIIPSKYKKCDSEIYRVMAIEKDLLTKKPFKIKTNIFSSWSYDLKIVETFSKSGYFIEFLSDLKNPIKVFFKYKPSNKDVFINLHTLWSDKDFINAIKKIEETGYFFDEGLELGDIQKEVILNQIILKESNILKTE